MLCCAGSSLSSPASSSVEFCPRISPSNEATVDCPSKSSESITFTSSSGIIEIGVSETMVSLLLFPSGTNISVSLAETSSMSLKSFNYFYRSSTRINLE